MTHGLTRRPLWTALRARMPAPSITDGFDVFVQLVMAAITTCPWSSSVSVPSSSVTGVLVRVALGDLGAAGPALRSVSLAVEHVRRYRVAGREAVGDRLVLGVLVGEVALERPPEALLGLGQRDAILRALRSGDARYDRAQVELEPRR